MPPGSPALLAGRHPEGRPRQALQRLVPRSEQPPAVPDRRPGALRELRALSAPGPAGRLHTGAWWELDTWNPRCDPRIPLRDRELLATTECSPGSARLPWVRDAIKWHLLGAQLQSGALTWTTIAANRILSLLRFDRCGGFPRLGTLTRGQDRPLPQKEAGRSRCLNDGDLIQFQQSSPPDGGTPCTAREGRTVTVRSPGAALSAISACRASRLICCSASFSGAGAAAGEPGVPPGRGGGRTPPDRGPRIPHRGGRSHGAGDGRMGCADPDSDPRRVEL